MTTTPTPEAIEAAARAMYVSALWHKEIAEHDSDRKSDSHYKEKAGVRWDEGHAGPSIYSTYRRLAVAALTAAGPLIASQALREAAAQLLYGNHTADWLRSRAATVARDVTP